ncbi:MAG: diacylglycerol kinase family protein [Saprospiraceae bacterium]
MKRLLSFKYAFKGAQDLFRSQPNARIHVVLAIAVLGMGLWLGLTGTEWAIISLCIFGVLAAEAFNTALEYLTDLVSPEYHVLAGKAKDAAAAAVLIFAIGTALAGWCILGPKIWLRMLNFF